ncbi:MAG: hypothetical protein ACLPVF_01785 [Acidimicrobiales bacterium]
MASSVLAAESDLEAAAPTGRPRRRWRTWVLGVSLCALGAAGLGYLVGNEAQANTQFDQAHASLDRTGEHFTVVLADLDAVRQSLRVADGHVGADTATFTEDTTELKGIEATLALARANVAHQGSTIADLQTCLGGVEQALNALSVGDLNDAIGQLTTVTPACQEVLGSDG